MSEPSITDQQSSDEDEISLLDLFIVLAKHKKVVLGLPIIAGVVAVVWSLLMPDMYTASTKLLPPQGSQSSAAGMLAQISGLAGAAGGALGIKSPSDTYVAMLRSRTLSDAMIERFDLNKVFGRKFQSDTQQVLQNMTKIRVEKEGVITIEVESKDAKQATELANAYVDELYKMTNVLAVTEASQRRLFYETQLAQARDNLARADVSTRRALERGGIAEAGGEARAMLAATASLRGQITVEEIRIGAMRAFATENNPELQRAERQVAVMKQTLARLEGANGNTGASRSKIGESRSGNGKEGVDTSNSLRDIKYYETIYELLAKQFELAKIDEAKDSTTIQVLDKAIMPDRKSGPNRRQFVTIWVMVALSIAILWSFICEALMRVSANPRQAGRLQALKRYLAWR